jgi:hypothetical protein
MHDGFQDSHGCAQNAENDFGFQFLERRYKDDAEFLNNIARVIGDEIWVPFMNVEIKEQSPFKAVHAHTHTHTHIH